MDKQQLLLDLSQTNGGEARVLQPRLKPDEGKNTLFLQIRFSVITYKQNL